MVQITNTLVAAAIIVPAIAAPVLESREPKGFRSIAKVAGKVASGASLGLTVGGLLQGREEIEAREPRITSAQAKSFAKGAGAIAHTAKSGIEFGAAVAPLFPHKQRRDIEAREPRITSAQAKSIAKGAGAIAHTAKSGIEFGAVVAPLFPHKQRRDVEELDARKFRVSASTLKTAGHAVAGAAGFAGTVAALNTQRQQRDFDDSDLLEAREPKFRVSASTLKHAGHAVAGAAGFAGTVAALNTQQQRDFDDAELDARHFSLGKVFKTVGKVAGNFIREDEMDLAEREFDDELETREPKFRVSASTLKHAGHAVAGAAGFAGTVAALNTQQQRDFDDSELDARHFSLGKVFKTVGKVAGNFIREDEMDLAEREFDDAELETREPKFRVSASTLKHAGHAVAGAAGFAGTVAALNTQQQRDFDDSELDARHFSLGKVFKTVGKVAGNFIREDEMELDAREPEPEPFLIGGLVKTAFKAAKHFIRDEETGDIYVVRETSFDELD